MSIARLLTEPVTIIRRTPGTVRDEYGNVAPVEADPIETVGYLEQTAATEVIVDRETYISDWFIALPADTEIDSTDRIVALGRQFEVIGEPNEVWNPRLRAVSHKELQGKEIVG